MTDVKVRLGPNDHGRAMSLDEFADAEGEPGHSYELAAGVVHLVEVPGLPHETHRSGWHPWDFGRYRVHEWRVFAGHRTRHLGLPRLWQLLVLLSAKTPPVLDSASNPSPGGAA